MKTLKNITALIFFFLWANILPSAWAGEDEEKWYDAISIGFGTTGILQGVTGTNHDQADWAYSVDLEIAGEIANGHNLYVVFESGNGDGMNDNIGSRAVPNYDAFISLFGNDMEPNTGEQRLNISQAYYEGELFDGKATIAFGLMDFHALTDNNAFANNETEQFINGMFVRSAGLIFQEHEAYYAYTFMLAVKPTDWFSFIYTYGKQHTENLFSEGSHFLELGLHPVFGALEGNYRIGFILDDADHNNFRTGRTESNEGINISIDQMLHEHLGIFCRFAWIEDDLQENEVTSFWSVGAQVGGGLWGRPNDVVGLAHGQVNLNQALITVNNEGETVTEVYYKFFVNDHVSLTADSQVFTNLETATDRDVWVFSFRSQISF